MTMSEPTSKPGKFRYTSARIYGSMVLIGLIAFGVFAYRLSDEPHFVDESAYYSQSGYADLLLNDRNNIAWLDYAGFDLPPLPKYLIGWSLQLFGYPRPNPRAAWDWYHNTSRRFETTASLTAARWPSVVLGAIGCVAIYALGTIACDGRVGFLAAVFLILNPLYRLHARRSMSDVPAEAFMLVALALGLWAWVRFVERRGILWPFLAAVGAGVAVGLSVLSKLNGTLSGLILGGWAFLALLIPGISSRARIGILTSTSVAGVVSIALFVLLNPFLTAQPRPPIEPRLASVALTPFWGRVQMVKDHRVEASKAGQKSFPDDALLHLQDKIAAIAVQGFGRFGLLGPSHSNSKIRFDPRQDWGAWIWGPLVGLGLVLSLRMGFRQRKSGATPKAWAIPVQSVLALVVVTLFIPLAWDRYYLSIQPGSCLLASIAVVEMFDFLRRALRR